MASPRKLINKLDILRKRSELTRKRLSMSKRTTRRLRSKTTSLKYIVKILQKKNLISSHCQEMLNTLNLTTVPRAILNRCVSGPKARGVKYSDELKTFALTLQFYSSKAYEYVRKSFNLALPHQANIRKWYSGIPAEPGFTEPAFQSIKDKVEKASLEGKEVVVSLMLDEMAIRKHVSWDGKKYRGYVDIGQVVNGDDSLPVAKDALVFMVVCINGSWKVPCAYFLIDGLTGKERANLINVCLEKLWETGAQVVSLTCDGPSCHFSMLSELGVSMNIQNFVTCFSHPKDDGKRVHALLDVCHMLKLVRNTFADGGVLVDEKGDRIRWQYIIELQKLQSKEGLRLGNKLKLDHIEWRKQKMKVNLAAQALSCSVADALEYCAVRLNLKQFKGSAATIRFIRIFDRLFDILNSRNPFAKGFKSPLRAQNKFIWQPFLLESFEYIMNLKDTTGRHMYETHRKTRFIGFLAAIKSVQGIYHDTVEKESSSLKYLLTYKLSQDHLELFFGAIRCCGGFNNNPTSQQFTAAYKRLLMRSGVIPGAGNCEVLDSTTMLEATEGQGSISNASIIRKYDLSERSPMQYEHDYGDVSNVSDLSEFKKAAITYVSGYAAKMTLKQIHCLRCSQALGTTNTTMQSKLNFVSFKDRGGLFKPSKSVIKICQEAERCFQRLLVSTRDELPHRKGISDAIAASVLSTVGNAVFSELHDHMFDCAVEDNHIFSLCKIVTKSYCTIKLHHLGKETT